jgi:hypothetical protein
MQSLLLDSSSDRANGYWSRVQIQLPLNNSGLYYKPMTIINDDSRVINKLEASLTDDARVIIYDCHMFIVQATAENDGKKLWQQKQCW